MHAISPHFYCSYGLLFFVLIRLLFPFVVADFLE